MLKNVASQKFYVRAFADAGHASLDPGEPVTGDAAQITAKIGLDYAAASATNDTNPTEIEDGIYAFDLTQAETNADVVLLLPESSTAGVQVVALPSNVVYTRPQYFSDLGIESDGDLTKVNTLHGHTAQTADHTSSLTTLTNRLGAWTGTGVNTVLGAFKALLSKTASTPSDIGGTFSPADDSVEAIRDRGDAEWITATGFSTHGDPDPSGFLDAAISSRQPSGAVDLNADQSGVTIGTVTTNSDMRGTDNAATEAKQDIIDNVVDGIATVLSGITSLAEWLGLLAGKQTGNATARTEIRATGAGSGSFDETTDSLEAIRDTEPLGTAMRGTDGANTTTPLTAEEVNAEVDTALSDYAPAQAGDAMTLTVGERNDVADALLDRADAVETGTTPREALRYMAAALVGTSSNDGKTFTGIGVATVRITATVSGKNRTSVTLS